MRLFAEKSDPLAEFMLALKELPSSKTELEQNADSVWSETGVHESGLFDVFHNLGTTNKLWPVSLDQEIIKNVFALNRDYMVDVGQGGYLAMADDRIVLLIHVFERWGRPSICWRARVVPRNAQQKDDIKTMPRKRRGSSKRRDSR